MLVQRLFHIYAKSLGWTWKNNFPVESKRCVLLAAPHTSNWDLIYGMGMTYNQGVPIRFTIKEEWMIFPFKKALVEMGALGINRKRKEAGTERPSMVEVMCRLFLENTEIAMTITPEGTRSRNNKWKTGFWHTAKKSGVPICFAYLDYSRKEVGIGGILYPTDNLSNDMKVIADFYRNISPLRPSKFAVDESIASPDVSL